MFLKITTFHCGLQGKRWGTYTCRFKGKRYSSTRVIIDGTEVGCQKHESLRLKVMSFTAHKWPTTLRVGWYEPKKPRGHSPNRVSSRGKLHIVDVLKLAQAWNCAGQEATFTLCIIKFSFGSTSKRVEYLSWSTRSPWTKKKSTKKQAVWPSLLVTCTYRLQSYLTPLLTILCTNRPDIVAIT